MTASSDLVALARDRADHERPFGNAGLLRTLADRIEALEADKAALVEALKMVRVYVTDVSQGRTVAVDPPFGNPEPYRGIADEDLADIDAAISPNDTLAKHGGQHDSIK